MNDIGGSSVLESLAVAIVQAPMAGGPSTPALAAAVGRGGGLGFLAAGYLTAERLQEEISTTRSQTDRFGVNVFAPGGQPADPDRVQEYAGRLREEAERAGIALGPPHFNDDAFEEKIKMLRRDPVATVSFTFGIPPGQAIEQLHAAGSEVWMTVTSPDEARRAASAGADALIVQGVEAGGHRGVFVDDDSQSDLTLLAALQLVRAAVDLPLIGAGSVITGGAIAAVLAAGARAAQIGTAYLLAAEAGTAPAQREATATETSTVLTRAFSGRLARGIANRFHYEYGSAAPRAYPEIHHLTSPLRAHARAVGDPDLINLWAGQTHSLAQARSAEAITRGLAQDACDAMSAAMARLR